VDSSLCSRRRSSSSASFAADFAFVDNTPSSAGSAFVDNTPSLRHYVAAVAVAVVVAENTGFENTLQAASAGRRHRIAVRHENTP